jgi:hypothetical protein
MTGLEFRARVWIVRQLIALAEWVAPEEVRREKERLRSRRPRVN